MIPVATMAACPGVFQVTTLALRLAAVFSVFAFRFLQLALGIVDLLFAFSVAIVIAVHRRCGNGSAQERRNHNRRNEYLGSLEHASPPRIAYTSYSLECGRRLGS